MFSFLFKPLQSKEKQEEMALDMKMLDKILQDSQAQAFEDTNKKVS